jgi:hypothetical protein
MPVVLLTPATLLAPVPPGGSNEMYAAVCFLGFEGGYFERDISISPSFHEKRLLKSNFMYPISLMKICDK